MCVHGPTLLASRSATVTRAGLHDKVPDRPSAKAAPMGCQLATTALKKQTHLSLFPPNVFFARQKLSPSHGRQCIWAEFHETGGLCATLAVNRLGRCRATRLYNNDIIIMFSFMCHFSTIAKHMAQYRKHM